MTLLTDKTMPIMVAALAGFKWHSYSPTACRMQAECFSTAHFRQQIAAFLTTVAA